MAACAAPGSQAPGCLHGAVSVQYNASQDSQSECSTSDSLGLTR